VALGENVSGGDRSIERSTGEIDRSQCRHARDGGSHQDPDVEPHLEPEADVESGRDWRRELRREGTKPDWWSAAAGHDPRREISHQPAPKNRINHIPATLAGFD